MSLKRQIVHALETTKVDDTEWVLYPLDEVGTPLEEITTTDPLSAVEASQDRFEWPPDVIAGLRKDIVPDDADKPVLNAFGYLNVQRDDAIRAILDPNERKPVFFRRGGIVTEITRNEKGWPGATIVDQSRMRDRMSETAYWVNQGGKPASPRADVASVILKTPGFILPALDAIVEHPVLAKDGSMRTVRGYDKATATFYEPSVNIAPLGKLRQPATRVALAALDGVFRDFPFVDKADKVNALALLVTHIVRPIIAGPVPLTVVTAPSPGSGKSMLVESIITILTGRPPTPTALTVDEDEANKRLMAELLKSPQIVYLDNARTGNVVDSATLAAMLASRYWEQRVIRTSFSPKLPIRNSWVVTGNNVTLSPEIARRSYLIALDAGIEHPEDRPKEDFQQPNLIKWVTETRADKLNAALVLVKAWADDGMTITGGPELSEPFGEWSQVVGSILRFAGLADFLGNEDKKRESAVDETEDLKAVLLSAIHDAMGEETWTVRDLWERTRDSDREMAIATAPFLSEKKLQWYDDGAPAALGNTLRSLRTGVYNRLQLVRNETRSSKGAVYRVRQR